ncbi:hypothetical protein B2G71_15800 [Novosphingobium sp. PC22D]|uniref:F0F1 ATP synthase subunit delta n=1 Tax=Novosphingobium sp. PC22D TaxID=1962403 RepID=UPI000BF087CA|nr:F0F1 ATP synthase subunit delta [Novosphingobium sp. PC22D]PEQ11592.1 hypothetical protein B2G71_15800 [Novosphingobium sp. PC22D]
MQIDWWTLGLQTVNLLVLLWLLARFLFRPMAAMVARRQADTDRLLDSARAARDEAEAAKAAAVAARAAADAERAGIIAAAQKDAEAQREAILDKARQEAQAHIADAEDRIGRMQDDADARIGHRASVLATDIAARLLAQPGARLPLSAFLGGLVQALAGLPDAAREAIGAGDDAPVLVSARPLGEADLAACHAAIAEALGREVALKTEVDPDLIAGLRFTSASVEVNANLRDDLARILAGLDRHDR